jgi:site-specific recombinase XerD
MYCLPLYNKEYIKLLEDFEKVIVAQGYSGGKTNLPRTMREFLFFLETKRINNIKDVQTSDIIEYYEYLMSRPNMIRDGVLSGNAIRTMLRSVSYFFEHLVDSKVIESTPCSIPRLPPGPFKERIPLTEEEVKQLYKVATDKTDLAILACAYGCGMRRLELSSLDISDVVFGKKEVAVRKSKNYKSRSIPMAEGVIKDLKDYLAHGRPRREMHGQPTSAFFLNKNGSRMLKTSYNKRFWKLVLLTGNKELITKKPSIHSLRHSIATHMIDRGADVNYVRRFLGHTLLDTTVGIYAKRRKQKAKLYKLFRAHLEEHNIKSL